MTTPDPRTDLAGYLGLTDERAARCHKAPVGTVAAAVGARLIEQDQARADEPDDGQHAMLDIDALGGPKMLRETMCVAQGAVLREGHAGAQLHADRIASIIDVCDQHRPLGPDGKHGTRRCTPTCGCIDKRDPEPDDGLIAVTVRLTAQEVAGEGEGWDTAVDKLCDACAAIDLPAPKPPWTSPLPNLPDLTEQEARYIWDQVVRRQGARASVGRPTVAETPETPTPSLADTFTEAVRVCSIARNGNDTYNVTGPHDVIHLTLGDLRAAAAQLRQLDRIKAAAGDARAVADALIESGDIVVPTSAPAAVDLLLRLADALEADDGA